MPEPTWPLASGYTPGSAPLIVYLHGLGCAASLEWPRVAQSPALTGRASLWVDLLGFGQSPRLPEHGYDLVDQAERLLPLLARYTQPVVLVGHSMGGTLAVILAERLVARGRSPDAVLLAEPNLRPQDATISAQAAALPLDRFVQGWAAWSASVDTPGPRQSLQLSDPTAFHRSAVSLVHHSAHMLPRFAALPVARKGYILGGKSGAHTHETAALTRAAGIPLVRVDGSGHDFSWEDPTGFAEAIVQLLES